MARADEEIEKLRTLFPSYPYLARDTFRTRLVALSATSRFDEAAEMARSRPVDMPLSREEELLCDALRVNAGDSLPTGERERIELEVRDEPEGAFFDRVAPSLRTGVHANANGRHRPRVVIPDDLAAPYSELPTSAEEADAEAILAKKIQLGLPT